MFHGSFSLIVMQCSDPIFVLIGSWESRKKIRVIISLSENMLWLH